MTLSIQYLPSEEALDRSKAATAASWHLLDDANEHTATVESLDEAIHFLRPPLSLSGYTPCLRILDVHSAKELPAADTSEFRERCRMLSKSANFSAPLWSFGSGPTVFPIAPLASMFMGGGHHFSEAIHLQLVDLWSKETVGVVGVFQRLQSAYSSKNTQNSERLRAAIMDAIKFLARLPKAPTPIVALCEEGEVTLEWRSEKKRAMANFEGDGEFGYALLADNGKFSPGRENGAIEAEHLPTDLIEYLADMPL